MTTRSPLQIMDVPQQTTHKSNLRGFRFKPDQRAFLEHEAVTNGSSPNAVRRAELAAMLGAEEQSVRVGADHTFENRSANQL